MLQNLALLQIIHSATDINSKIEQTVYDVHTGVPKTNLYTLLQIAAYTFNFEAAKLLLEKGADPNILNSDNQSLLEILMESIGELLSHIPFQAELLQTHLLNIEKIIDILLCYGLNSNFEWTKGFIAARNDLRLIAFLYLTNNELNLKHYLVEHAQMITCLQIAIEGGHISPDEIILALQKIKAHAHPPIPTNNEVIASTHEFVLTSQTAKESMAVAAKNIDQEKMDCVSAHQNKIDEALDRKWPVDLVNMVSQYAMDVPEEISKKRAAEKRTLGFWKHRVRSSELFSEDEKSNIQQRASYKVRLRGVFCNMDENTKKLADKKFISIISDYALGSKKP